MLKIFLMSLMQIRGFIFGLEPPHFHEELYKSFGPPREIGMSLTYSF